ncbi:MAG: hypothetical protein QOF24_43 [Verrucomicrobiota bacterium]|jgi:hypothetical protein
MKIASKKLPLLSLIIAFVVAQALAQQMKADETARTQLNQAYGKLPLAFEANQGQTDPHVKFLSRGNGYSLFLTPTEAVIVLGKTARDDNTLPGVLPNQAIKDQREAPKSFGPATVLRMKLMGGNPTAKIAGTGELPSKSNYLIGNHSEQWHTNLSNYTKVEYREVYPGIDLVYYGNQRQLEHDFVIAPGADPKAIRLAFQGARKISINSAGDLVLDTKGGEVQLKQPRVYQNVDGAERKIAARYVLKGRHRVAFEVAEYDRRQPLVIDPVLSYSTYLGGGGYDQPLNIAVDISGNAYVTGYTTSTNFPTTPGAYQTTIGSSSTAFVTKLNPTGSAVVYSTYLGGNGSETGFGIAVDASGNAYVAGLASSTNFPTTPGAFQTTFGGGGGGDCFVTKLNSTGDALIYSTYLGGSLGEGFAAIAVDASGNAYVTGFTNSTNFPTTPGAFQTTFGGASYYSSTGDGFVTKLNPTGSALVYSTYLGGNRDDYGHSIAVDALGNAYVTGFTESLNFPTTFGAYQTANGGGIPSRDAFVIKLNPTGDALVYSTYLGGSGEEYGLSIAVDSAGDAYVTGYTIYADFPTTPGAFQTTRGSLALFDAFVTKLNSTGNALIYSTYLAGSGDDYGFSIAVDISGNAYVTGSTSSTNFPTTPGAVQTTYGGNPFDCFVTKLNPTGDALVFSTYLGGASDDFGAGIRVNAFGNAYVTGYTTSTNFPTTPGAFQTSHGGGFRDAFIAKISEATPTPTPTPASPYHADVQPPINADGTSVFTAMRGVIPVKFSVTQNGSPTCALPPANIAVTRTSGANPEDINESVYTMSADSGSNFKIAGCQYSYNLSAGALGPGTYRVDIKINGQVVGSAIFQLK